MKLGHTNIMIPFIDFSFFFLNQNRESIINENPCRLQVRLFVSSRRYGHSSSSLAWPKILLTQWMHERMFLHTSATKNNRNKRTFDRPALTSWIFNLYIFYVLYMLHWHIFNFNINYDQRNNSLFTSGSLATLGT